MTDDIAATITVVNVDNAATVDIAAIITVDNTTDITLDNAADVANIIVGTLHNTVATVNIYNASTVAAEFPSIHYSDVAFAIIVDIFFAMATDFMILMLICFFRFFRNNKRQIQQQSIDS